MDGRLKKWNIELAKIQLSIITTRSRDEGLNPWLNKLSEKYISLK